MAFLSTEGIKNFKTRVEDDQARQVAEKKTKSRGILNLSRINRLRRIAGK